MIKKKDSQTRNHWVYTRTGFSALVAIIIIYLKTGHYNEKSLVSMSILCEFENNNNTEAVVRAL